MNKNYLLLIAALLMAASFTLAGCGGSDSGGGFFYIPPKTGLPATKTVYFAADDGYAGLEPWRTNGTAAGTAIVNNINPEDLTPSTSPNGSDTGNFTEAGGRTYFTADDGTGNRLFVINASGKAEEVLDDLGGSLTAPARLTDVGGTLYFTESTWLAFVNSGGKAIEVYDDLGGSLTAPARLTDVGGTLYLTESSTLAFVNSGNKVIEVYDDLGGSLTNPDYLTNVGGTLYLTEGSTLAFVNSGNKVIEIYNDGGSSLSSPQELFAVGGTLYLDENTTLAMVNSGGKAVEVLDDLGGSADTPYLFTDVGGTLYFSDGTGGLGFVNSSGVIQFVEDDSGTLDSAGLFHIAAAGSRAVFFYDDGTHGLEPWIINASGKAELLMDINDLPGMGSFDFVLDEVSNVLFFVADTPEYGNELWRTDGTKAGTALVKDINTRTHFSSPATAEFTEFDAGGLFKANGGERYGNELFFTDGTVAGTVMLKDINPGPGSSNPGSFISAGENVFFSADSAAASGLLAMSNGTEAGTVFITNAADGSDIYMADVMATDYDAADNTLYFTWDGKVFYVDTAAMEAIEIQDATDSSIVATAIGKLGMAVYISTGSKLYYVSGSMIAFEVGTDLAVVDVAAIGNTVYFSTAGELYTIDSEAAPGTESDITNSSTGDPITGADDLFEANGKLFFVADSFASGNPGTFYIDASGDAREILTGGTTTLRPTLDPDKFFLASDGTLYVMGLNNGGLFTVDTNAADPLAPSVIDLGATNYSLDSSSIMESGGTVYVVDTGDLFFDNGAGTAWRIGAFGASSGAQNLMDVGGVLYLTDGASDLYRAVPGPALGTVTPIEDDNAVPAPIDAFNASNAVVANGTLFFTHIDADAGNEVHVVSGGNTNATLIDINTNININSGHSAPGNFYDGSDAALFSARDGDHGVEFWVSDGTPGGTMMVKDLNTDTYDAF